MKQQQPISFDAKRNTVQNGNASPMTLYWISLAAWLFLGGTLHAADSQSVSVVERNGRDYVSAKALATVLHIGLKSLPGRSEFVLCHEDRCALTRSVVTNANGDYLVEIVALAKALSAKARFTAGRTSVAFTVSGADMQPSETLPQLGSFAPNLTLTTLAGKPVSLSDYRGRRLLINSWASWCGCRNDLPAWEKFYEKHRARDFEILSVAVDVQGAKVVRPYVEKAGVTFSVAVDESDVLGCAFGLKLTPVSILVDELGIIRALGNGPKKDFLAQIETILDEPLSEAHTEPQAGLSSSSKVKLRKCIAASPDDWRARINLAVILVAEGDLAEATRQLAAAAQFKPEDAGVHFLTGQILLQQQKREEALASFRKARELDPANWRIRKQIWAIENPEKFYARPNPDYRWQKEALEKERTASTPVLP
ncbi:MAG: redoxin family protein [Verrucomicrobiota bacterium]